MRILACSDLHGSTIAARRVMRKIAKEQPDLVIVCGDITDFGPAEWAKEFLDRIDVKTLALPGNCDPEDVIRAIEQSKAQNLHGKKIEVEGNTFAGFGGSNVTPFGTLLEFSEEEIYKALDAVIAEAENTLLVTHCPPRGKLDYIAGKGSLGSTGVREIVDKYKPRLVLSGHIHEAKGIERGETTYVNPGKASQSCAVIEIEDGIRVRLI